MYWKTLSEDSLVRTPWFSLSQAKVELPDGRRIDHYVFRLPAVVLTAVLDEQDRVMLVWRYRFIPDSWGWELPSGLARAGDDLAAAAASQALQETGWEPRELRYLVGLEPSGGLTDSVHHVFWTRHAELRGEPGFETERLDWIPLRQTAELVARGQIRAASTAAAMLLLSGYVDPGGGR